MAETTAEIGEHNGGEYDYIVVGSGAGGGPVAANLARAGFTVLLLEAGSRTEAPSYQVPAFHPFATEDESMRWDYFVRHYADGERSRRDPKFCDAEDGVLYPRAGTLGGCTAHHAMIMMYPHDSDWDHIAELTGDESWSAEAMRGYFQRLERKGYRRWSRLIYRLTRLNFGHHGYDGWLPVTMASPKMLFDAPRLSRLVIREAIKADSSLRPRVAGLLSRLLHLVVTARDVNAWSRGRKSKTGVRLVPVSIRGGRRRGTRELIEDVERDHPDRLRVAVNALVTEIVFEGENGGAQPADPTAIGVRYLSGERLYAAAPTPASAPSSYEAEPPRTVDVRCRHEVILCAGAFNTPQLLMLSGIGPKDDLERHGIAVRADRPGVGRNLQDRYEVGVVVQMKHPFELLEGARFEAPGPDDEPEPRYEQWLKGKGPYTTNGVVVTVIRRSDESQPEPDLFCLGLTGGFRGYYPGYSREALEVPSFTWAILKAHTENRAGTVTLASSDPRHRPRIGFSYFDEGSGDHQRDLDAVVAGVRFIRELNEQNEDLMVRELIPGPDVVTTDDIEQFVKDQAWGHHASCTCRIGRPDDPMAVIDSRFRVLGVGNLRVVDASVFPRIPGSFIVTPIYMIAEKASDVIIEDARAVSR